MRYLGMTTLLAAGLAVAAPAQEDRVGTAFSVLVGFPSAGAPADAGAVLVPGTMIPLAGVETRSAPGASRELVDRSVSYSRSVEALWETFRLDPMRRLQEGTYEGMAPSGTVTLPAPKGTGLAITATLLSRNESMATYRLVLKRSDAALADTTLGVKRGGRAVVGAVDGPEAPYVFVFIEAETAGGAIERFAEGSGLTAPSIVTKVDPQYPEEARNERVVGMVVLEAIIGTDGRVEDVRPLQGPDSRLTEAAVDAVRRWTYSPARRTDGTPVRVRFTITVRFALK